MPLMVVPTLSASPKAIKMDGKPLLIEVSRSTLNLDKGDKVGLDSLDVEILNTYIQGIDSKVKLSGGTSQQNLNLPG